MQKQLFFDDNNLFARDNAIRRYGEPKPVASYNDGISSTDYCTGWVFRLDSGRYRMLYFGQGADFKGLKVFLATSEDGVHFAPETIGDDEVSVDRRYPHEIMTLGDGCEIASIYEDTHTDDASTRYKMLLSEHLPRELAIVDAIYTSPDLIRWTRVEDAVWGDGTEPQACVFYNEKYGCHTIIERSFWGIRCAGYKETRDWRTFTDYQPCLNVDAADERLSEIYGMPAVFDCGGTYVGLIHLYHGLDSELNAKYKNGIIDTQLAYSYDGRYWKRGMREPFISGVTGNTDKTYPVVWMPCVREWDDGVITIYGSASEFEHGPAFRQPGTGRILVYKLRRDGFITLATEDKTKPSVVALRELAWHGGEAHINLKAKRATVAVYCSNESENVGGNVLGISHLVEGYSHDDCIPFEGDSTDWVPTYKNSNTLDALKGKTLVLEVRYEEGELYSISGDFTLLFNTPAARYRKFGVLPK